MRALAQTAADLRAEVMAQPPAERLDYALGFLDLVCAPPPAWDQTARDLGVEGLPPSPARILHRLAIAEGRAVSFEALEAAAEFEGLSGGRNALKCAVRRLRAGISAAGCPVVISTFRGVGYMLEAAPELTLPGRRR